MYPDDATDPETLIKYADTAMERAKQAGRDGYRFFTAGMNVQVLARLDMELALRRAFDNNELLLHFQPKVNLNTGKFGGVESLLRWQRPGIGLVYRPNSCRCWRIAGWWCGSAPGSSMPPASRSSAGSAMAPGRCG